MSINKLLHDAQQACKDRGVRLTDTRFKVLKLLAQQQQAIGAYDLLELLKESVPQAKPPTVYRALDFLLEQGFAHKITLTNSFVVCSHFDHHHQAQMLICKDCHTVQEVHSEHVDDEIIKQASKHGFDLHHQTIEAVGICNNCREHDGERSTSG